MVTGSELEVSKGFRTQLPLRVVSSDEEAVAFVMSVDYDIVDAAIDVPLPWGLLDADVVVGYFPMSWATSAILIPLTILAGLRKSGRYKGLPRIIFPARPSRVDWQSSAASALVKALTDDKFIKEFLC